MLDEIEVDDDADTSADDASDSGESWYSGGNIKRAGWGLIFLGSLVLLFWNEGFGKRRADSLVEISRQVQTVGSASIDPAFEGKPVHLSAPATSQGGSRDEVFGVHAQGVALYRHVEMLQWVEYEETEGRGRKKRSTYYYELEWDSQIHDSSQFEQPQGHENPKPALESAGFFASDARFGPYRFDNVTVMQRALRDMDRGSRPGSLGNWPEMVETLPELSETLRAKRWYTLEPGVYYRGDEASDEAQLGDLRVSFYAFPSGFQLTQIGAQLGDRIEPWPASSGDRVLLLRGGNMDAQALIQEAQAMGSSKTHMLRIIGLVGAVLGAIGVAQWLGGFLTGLPLVGGLINISLMLAGGLFGLCAGLSAIVIGWLMARPWIAAIAILAIGAAIAWAIRQRQHIRAQTESAARALRIATAAKLKQAQDALTPPPPPMPAMAGAGAAAATPMARSAPTAAAPKQETDESKELPPLEWTPGLIATKPPSVRTPVSAVAAPAAAAPAPQVRPPATPRREPPMAPPALFDTVEPRTPTGPLFDTVEPRRPTPPLFDTVEQRSPAPALFDTVELRPRPAATPSVAAPRRIALGSKGPYSLHKIVRARPDGSDELVCFELQQSGKPLLRGTQEQVKERLRVVLAAPKP